jgi:hypothetical protein
MPSSFSPALFSGMRMWWTVITDSPDKCYILEFCFSQNGAAILARMFKSERTKLFV